MPHPLCDAGVRVRKIFYSILQALFLGKWKNRGGVTPEAEAA